MMDVKLHESIIYPKQSDFQMLQELIFNPWKSNLVHMCNKKNYLSFKHCHTIYNLTNHYCKIKKLNEYIILKLEEKPSY
jgi:hypothetical protein